MDILHSLISWRTGDSSTTTTSSPPPLAGDGGGGVEGRRKRQQRQQKKSGRRTACGGGGDGTEEGFVRSPAMRLPRPLHGEQQASSASGKKTRPPVVAVRGVSLAECAARCRAATASAAAEKTEEEEEEEEEEEDGVGNIDEEGSAAAVGISII